MILGVIADTHIPRRAKQLPGELLAGLQGVDHILHAGDIVDECVLEELALIAPVTAVGGNCDPAPLFYTLGQKKILYLGGYRIGLVHGDGAAGTTPERAYRVFAADGVDCIVFGHSHQAFCEDWDGTLMFNPGSPTDRRFAPYYSYGILELGEKIEGRIITF